MLAVDLNPSRYDAVDDDGRGEQGSSGEESSPRGSKKRKKKRRKKKFKIKHFAEKHTGRTYADAPVKMEHKNSFSWWTM